MTDLDKGETVKRPIDEKNNTVMVLGFSLLAVTIVLGATYLFFVA